MKVEQSFTIARPADEVWMFLQNIPDVAECMPNATLTGESVPGTYAGKISARLGPFSANFEGEVTVTFDQANRTGHAEGKGVDKRGGSRSRMAVEFSVVASAPAATTVNLDADLTLSGAIAQFGRTGIIQETANILIGEFVRNLEARLTERAPAPAAVSDAAPLPPGVTEAETPTTPTPALSAGRLILLVLRAWLRRVFGHSQA